MAHVQYRLEPHQRASMAVVGCSLAALLASTPRSLAQEASGSITEAVIQKLRPGTDGSLVRVFQWVDRLTPKGELFFLNASCGDMADDTELSIARFQLDGQSWDVWSFRVLHGTVLPQKSMTLKRPQILALATFTRRCSRLSLVMADGSVTVDVGLDDRVVSVNRESPENLRELYRNSGGTSNRYR